jgi:hypothetical protein
MPPEEDARAILRLALRHEQSLAASLDPAFAQENWGFLAQLELLTGSRRPEDLLALQNFAAKARCSPRSGCCVGSWKSGWRTQPAKA